MDEITTQIKIVADASAVESGVVKAKRSLADLGTTADKAGEQGARGLGKLNADSAAQSMDRATRSMVENIQRQTLAAERATGSNRSYFESLARIRGVNTSGLEPYLAQLEAVEARAKAATLAQMSFMDRARGMGGVAALAAAQIAALAGSFTLGAGFAFVKQVNDGIDALNDIRDATGATIESISGLEDVGRRTGTTFDTVGSILVKFNDLLSKASPKSDVALQLQAIGVSAEELRRLDPAEALRVTAVALSRYESDANKARLIQDLFGKSVKEAAAFLSDLGEQTELVAKVTTRQADEADRFNKELFALQTYATDASRALAGPMVTAINETIEAFRRGRAEGKGWLEISWERYRANVNSFMGSTPPSAIEPPINTGAVTASWGPPDPPKPSIVTPKTAAELAAAKSEAEKAMAALNRELAEQAKLINELNGLTGSFHEDWSRLSTMFAKGKLNLEQLTKAQADLLEKQPGIKAVTDAAAKSAKEEADAAMAAAKAYADTVEARQNSIAGIQQQIQREKDVAAAIGLTRREVADLEIAKLEEAATSRDRLALVAEDADLSGVLAKSYRDEAKALRELATAKRATAARQDSADAAQEALKASEDAAKKAGEAWQREVDDINRTLTDALMRSFEDGKGFAESFRDTVENMFKTLVLRPVISAVMSPVSGAVNGLVNGVLGGAGGTANSALGLANNASSLYGAYDKLSSWFGLGGSAASASSMYSLATGVSNLGTLSAGASSLYGSSLYSLGGAGSSGLGIKVGSQLGSLTAPTSSAVGGGGAAAASGGFNMIPIIGWILAGIAASNAMYGKGYSVNGLDDGMKMFEPFSLKTNIRYKSLSALGINDKWADILSGGPLVDKAFDLLGISQGERRFGGQYGYSATSDQIYNGRRGIYQAGTAGQVNFLEGPSGGEFGQDEVKKLISSTVEGINGIFKALESDARISDVWAGLEVSTNDKGGVFFGGRTNQGVSFGENSWESTSTRSPNAQMAFENLALDAQQATLQALQSVKDLPKSIAEYVKTLTPEDMTSDQIVEALTSIAQQASVIAEFRDALKQLPFENLKALSYDTAEALIAAAGGLDVLNTNLTGYFSNYFSAEEQRNAAIAAADKAFKELGLTMPSLEQSSEAARAQFRAMVESIDVTTEAGQRQYAGLLALQGAFADLTPAVEGVADAVKRSAADIASERDGLMRQLLQLQGNTAALRDMDLQRTAEGNRDILRQIWAIQDANAAQAAAQAAAAQAMEASGLRFVNVADMAMKEAAESGAGAAGQVGDAWRSIADSLVDEIKRIRGEIVGTGQTGFAAAQAEFAVAIAQARAGDQAAAESLPALSRQVLELAETNARSALDLKSLQAQIAASLAESLQAAGLRGGFTVPSLDVGTNFVPFDTLAQLHRGEMVVPAAFNPYLHAPAATAGATGSDAAQEVRALREEMADQRELLKRVADATWHTEMVLCKVTRNGLAMFTQEKEITG